jgi:protein-L-isoaspartate O-methyltransferase
MSAPGSATTRRFSRSWSALRGGWTAIEFDGELAARTTANLVQTQHASVVHGDGTRIVFEPVDIIYVDAGATRPADAWLDRLKEGGRLILPLTTDGFPNRDVRRGVVFRIERGGPGFFARPDLRGRRSFPVRAVVTRPANRHSPRPSTRAAPSA